MSMGGQIAHRLRRVWWRLRRPVTRGARVILTRPDGQLCLVRHTYGTGWYLPGGGLQRSEDPADGLRREVREELTIDVGQLSPLGTYQARAEGKRDTVWVFSAQTDADPVASGPEVAELGWFSVDGLPETTSPATRRRVQEWVGQLRPTGIW